MELPPYFGIIANVSAGIPQMLRVADNSIVEAPVPKRFVHIFGVDLAGDCRFIRPDNGA